MRVSVATPLLAFSVASTVAGNMNDDLTKRGDDIVAQMACNTQFIACVAACFRVQATHAREACQALCAAVRVRQLREADNNLPVAVDAPVITRRADLQALRNCNNSLQSCINDVNHRFNEPSSADPDDWETAIGSCGADFMTCARIAGYEPNKSCPVE